MKKTLLLFIVLAFAFSGVYAQSWNLTGNTGTNPPTNFIGTTDLKPLVFKTWGFERMRLLDGDKSFLGIGTPIPLATLHLHYDDLTSPSIQNLLQLTTPNCTTGFNVSYNKNTKAIYFKQQEEEKFFIEGPFGGFMINQWGNICFGTDEPEEKLHLVGKMIIDRTTTGLSNSSSLQFKHSDDIRDIGPGTPQYVPYHWDIYSDVQGLKFNTVLNSSGKTRQCLIISDGGNVGIGVTSPQAKLHVDTDILADGNITTKDKLILATDNTANNRWEISRTTTGLNYAYKTTSQRDILFISNDGKIGIGKTNPATALDVNGTATVTELNAVNSLTAKNTTISGPFTVNNIATVTGLLTATTDAKVNGLLTANNTTITGSLTARNTTINGPLTVNNTATVTGLLTASANAEVSGTLTAKSSATVTGLFTASANAEVSGTLTADGTLTANSNATVNGQLTVNNDATISGKLTANKIRVNEMLSAKEIKVQLANPWPDYVFSKEYNLLPLNQVEEYINENQHLPNVPSAVEVEENGIELGKMNAILLQKMEEMTLYILDLQKQIDELKKR